MVAEMVVLVLVLEMAVEIEVEVGFAMLVVEVAAAPDSAEYSTVLKVAAAWSRLKILIALVAGPETEVAEKAVQVKLGMALAMVRYAVEMVVCSA